MTLEELRQKIDELDEKLVTLLNERTQVVLDIGRLKNEQGSNIYAPAREKAVLDRVAALNKGPMSDKAMQGIYREIMSVALAMERKTCIAYLGPPATFTHQAARSKFGVSVEYHACETIKDVFMSVENGNTDYGVVPIENSTEGAVTHTLDEFFETRLKICAEIYLDISHNLMSNQPREQLTKVYSNPSVFGQCRRWLHENLSGVDLVAVSSTARAAEIAGHEDGAGALASKLAAELYGLDILNPDIQDLCGNTTRFLIVAKHYAGRTNSDKTSILFSFKDRVGGLYDVLAPFKLFNINMTKIESRPSKIKAWEYFFIVDFEGHIDDEYIRKALKDMEERCAVMKVLGSYPRGKDS